MLFLLGSMIAGSPHLLGQAGEIAGLRAAVSKLENTAESKVRYTYRDLSHTQNFNEKGKRTIDLTQLFDVTYIGGLEYSRLLEVNGRPLGGKALREEQERYDAAIRERSSLDAGARAKLEHHLQKDARIDLKTLAGGYRDSIVGHERIDGRDCAVVEAVPGEGGGTKSYRLWLDTDRVRIVRLDFLQLSREGEMLEGARGTKSWIYPEGVPVVSHSAVEATYEIGGHGRIRVLADHSYSEIKRFSATATLLTSP